MVLLTVPQMLIEASRMDAVPMSTLPFMRIITLEVKGRSETSVKRKVEDGRRAKVRGRFQIDEGG